MDIALIIGGGLTAIALLIAGIWISRCIYFQKKYGISLSDWNNLSVISRTILSEYHKIPVNHRPIDNLYPALNALDIKHGVSDVDYHFFKATYEGSRRFTICSDYKCSMQPYRDAYIEVKNINNAYLAHLKAAEIANISNELETAESMSETFKNKTKELTEATEEMRKLHV